MPLPRNPVIRAGAILRKGGAHTKSASGQRHRGKLSLRDEIDDWFDEADDDLNPSATQARSRGGDQPPSGQHLDKFIFWRTVGHDSRSAHG